jgi:indolepyruvate ferredoxin oxidoreductase alpha subunit
MMREAFDVSERLHSVIIIRETRSFAQRVEGVDLEDGPFQKRDLGLAREPLRFVPVPINVVEKHRTLHNQWKSVVRWMETLPYNRISGSGSKGIIGAGFAYQKLLDVMGDHSTRDYGLLKLSSICPLPEKLIARFLTDCDEVLVLEENEPFLETHIKAIAHDNGCRAKIFGKQSDHISQEGELFRWQIQEAICRFIPGFVPDRTYSKEKEEEERPQTRNYCADCRYGEILDVLEDAAASLQQKPVLVGDPGCLVTVAERLDAKYALGSAIAVADGMSKVGIGERAVAIFGDSSFFHTTLPAICNAVVNRSNILMIVLDNGGSGTSGFQPNPSVGKNALGEKAPILSMEKIARACGVEFVRSVGQDEPDSKLKSVFQEALGHEGLALVVVKTPCERPV